MLIILIALTLVGVVSVVLVNQFRAEVNPYAEPTIDDIVSLSFETEEITTNLRSNDFVRAKFLIHVDNKNALEEIQKRDFQVENIIIRSLAGKEATDLVGPEGIDTLEAELQEEINRLMQTGAVVKVYTTQWVVQ